MPNEDRQFKNGTPKDSHDWAHIWAGVHKAHEAWFVVGPLVAAVRNWKAWLAIMAVVTWINQPGIWAALKTLAGGGK